MCGIAGIRATPAPDPGAIRRMADALAHRGPDGEGFATLDEGRLLLGHRRLAILDLSPAGAQPMSRAGRFHLVYNGEIYNYRELRAELRGRGHEFASETDTEVLLAAFEEWGEACLPRLDGMFAFAVYDARERVLFAARDRFGEKPFHYADGPGGTFLFASEAKALVAAGHPARIDRDALFQYLAWDATDDPAAPERTFLEGVKSLPPAHSLRVGPDGRVAVRRWWSLPEGPIARMDFAAAAERFRELVETSVARRLRSDVPVGTSLSGGLDSSAIAGLVAQVAPGAARNAFSARFDDPALDEGRWMELVVARTGVEWHRTRPDAAAFAAALDDLVAFHEAPVSASGAAQYEVMRLARDRGVTVLLDGQGADEVLAGYLHFFRPRLAELLRTDRRAFVREREAYRARHGAALPIPTGPRFVLQARAPGLVRALGRLRRRVRPGAATPGLAPDFVRAHRHLAPPFRVHRTLDAALRHATTVAGLPTLLRLADRSSMAHSREVRLPFLAHELVEFAFALPPEAKLADGWTKRILRVALEDVLPPEIAWRTDKLGYRPPEAAWLRSPAVAPLVAEAERHLVAEGVLAAPLPGRGWTALMASRLLRGEPMTVTVSPPPVTGR